MFGNLLVALRIHAQPMKHMLIIEDMLTARPLCNTIFDSYTFLSDRPISG